MNKYVVRRGAGAGSLGGVDYELLVTPESAERRLRSEKSTPERRLRSEKSTPERRLRSEKSTPERRLRSEQSTQVWGYSGLRILDLPAGGAVEFDTGPDEMVLLPLSGGAAVACEGESFQLTGRRGVFTRVTDFAYLPMAARARVESAAGGRFALCTARATRKLRPRYGPADGVGVELRGAGQASRQVNNFCTPETFEADKLIAVEVLTPPANWSSYPPHKHDEQRPGEAQLEEIYYFEVGCGLSPSDGIAYQRVYTSGPGREIDVCAEVRSGDTVLIPHGWHGPSMAAPGYSLYYLNVMAGPSPDRAWLICDDPAHAWVRDTWSGQQVDARLPMTGTEERDA